MQSLSFRRRHANWFGFILAYIDKPGMTSHDSAETTNDRARPVEAAADRVMHLWSLIRMVPVP